MLIQPTVKATGARYFSVETMDAKLAIWVRWALER
jgi:hypothetical protein